MSIQQYECPICSGRIERLETKQDIAPGCRICQFPFTMFKVVSAPAIRFKGEGWATPMVKEEK